jgi:hypothetical protein
MIMETEDKGSDKEFGGCAMMGFILVSGLQERTHLGDPTIGGRWCRELSQCND